MSSDLREVRLPAELCNEAERRFAGASAVWRNFWYFVLRELLRDEAAQMDQAEQRVIEQRLRIWDTSESLHGSLGHDEGYGWKALFAGRVTEAGADRLIPRSPIRIIWCSAAGHG